MSFPYEKIEKENIVCNFCGEDNYRVLSKEGTDGLKIRSVICRNCALIYINPRMTKEGYGLYYEGEYRDKTINHGEASSGFSCQKLFDTTQTHGKFLGNLIKKFKIPEGAVMEVGSGVGGVLKGMKDVLGREVVGLEPSGQEAQFANEQGIKTYHSLIEDHKKQENFAVVVSTQSLNHFLDPKYFFTWAHNCLVNDGLLVVEVMNFRHQLKNAGLFKNAVKIDHVYMFTPEVLKNFISSAGFEILYCGVDEYVKKEHVPGVPRIHICIVARKLEKIPFKNLDTRRLSFIKNVLPLKLSYLYYLIFIRLPFFRKK